MAKSLIKGLSGAYEIEVFGRNSESLKVLADEGIETHLIGDKLDIENKNIVLCVKPYSIDDVANKIVGRANIVFSVLAGVSIDKLKVIKSKHYVRSMPNLGASYCKSMTTLTGDIELKEVAIDIFNKIGKSLWVNSEKELDIATGVAGSGPAFLALVAESLADGGVNQGLKREDAELLVKGLFDGFAALLENSDAPSIKNGVMSPGGTTAAGYESLEKNGVRFAMMDAIKTAYKKALELKK